ncbi:MAG TPA: hypothetical protein VFS05_05690 [Gemmatimonadaceae bacterium]|nr:hypothetical protein [Gemmatimonadaceae bacterium]
MTATRARLALLAALIPLAAACGDSSTAPDDPELVARVVAVVPTSGVQSPVALAEVELENVGGRPLWLPRCGEATWHALERREGVRWTVVATTDVCIAVLPMYPVSLAPGETRTTLVSIPADGRYRVEARYGHSAAEPYERGARTPEFIVE